MKNEDYIYYMYTPSEDAPCFHKSIYTYEELIKELNQIEDEYQEKYRPKFLLKEPEDWAYCEKNSIYIERLPKTVQPEVFIPYIIRSFR